MNRFSDLKRHQKAYLLLEKSTKVDVRRTLYEHEDNPHWVPLFADTQWEPYIDESPILIQTHSESAMFRWAIDALAGSEGIRGLVMESSSSLDVVADWCRLRLTVRFEGVRQGLLRFYDPLVWAALRPWSQTDGATVSRVHYWNETNEAEGWCVTDDPELVVSGEPAELDAERARAIRSFRV